MRSRLLQSLLLACALGASALGMGACTTVLPEHVPLSLAARDSIASTELIAPIKQNEIYLFVPASQVAAAGGGGLLLALIDAGVDSTRTHNAEEAVKPVRDAIVDFNFDEVMRADLQKSMSTVPFLKLDGARVIKEVTDASLDAAIVQSKASAVLFTTADYQLANDGSTLTVVLWANMFANSDALAALKPPKGNAKLKSALANALYRNRFTYTAAFPGTVGERPANLAVWSANNGAELRKALTDASAALAAKMAEDIQASPGVPVALADTAGAGR
jgi:hypothetical protein